jgi:hypothetical protein
MEEKIDFLITWVDVNDPKWLKDFKFYAESEGKDGDFRPSRYRDWENLRYWFRGVDQFSPWVNKIFFVTYGHVPDWLNINHPKLQIVRHEDFIPSQYLPTFNSNTIEFFFHRIKDLSERFVYFNDDTFLIDAVDPCRFFENGLPCDTGVMSMDAHVNPTMFDVSVFMANALINYNFDKKKAIRENLRKWYTTRYIGLSWQNFRFRRYNIFPGFMMSHRPQGYLKSLYDDIWNHCEDDLKRTCSHRFRSYGDVTFWLFRYWQLASGRFTPFNIFKDSGLFHIEDSRMQDIERYISCQKGSIVCLNDTDIMNFEDNKQRILNAFHQILPNKCSFER